MLRISSGLLAGIVLSTIISTTAAAQGTVVVRDKIEPLPPFSICQDGATHRTVVTRHRLLSKTSLKQFEGKAVEILGTPGRNICKFLQVSSVTVLPNDQWTVATKTPATLKVDFFGSGGATDRFMVFLSVRLANPAFFLPLIQGPIHLDAVFNIALGTHLPLGSTTPYLSLSTPTNPNLLGIDFFDQAVVLRTGGTVEMSNVDTFRF